MTMSKKQDNNEVEALREKLFKKRKNGFQELDLKEIEESDKFCEGYKDFLNQSKTERKSVTTAIKLAEDAGFKQYDSSKKYKAGDKFYFVNRNKCITLVHKGKDGLKNGAKISVAHIDAPRLDLKPNPLYEESELAFFKTHYYGGIKKYQWTAVPLSLHGVVVKKDGQSVEVCIGEEEGDPCFCITDLLPHLAKDQMSKTLSKSFTGEDLNVLIGSRPFKSDKGANLVKLNIMKLLNEKYDIIESDFISAELELVPAFKASDVGFDRSMVGSYGHDDRVCSYTSLLAMLDVKTPQSTAIAILADKEEVGSDGNTGMKSSFFRDFIEGLSEAEGLKVRDVLAKSYCLSADVNAAFDPNFASVYEKTNSCFLNHGVVITKYTGSGGKSGTSDASAEFMGQIRNIFEKEKILCQSGELGKVDAGGGGTIAKFIANLNLDVVDIGVPVISMHSPFEVVSKIDVYMTYKAIKAFFKS